MTTLPFRSIRSLCSLAFAEGEGIGTAYEYFVKRLLLAPWLARLPRPKRLLIAGLPEKFGYSLDLLLVAQELAAPDIVVADERPRALEGVRQSLAAAQAVNELKQVRPRCVLVASIEKMDELNDTFDLCLTFGVVQRLDAVRRCEYVNRLASLAQNLALFAPNAGDASYQSLGMSALSLTNLQELAQLAGILDRIGYVDIPPWPPGTTQSVARRNRHAHGRIAAPAMLLLQQYACQERALPLRWQRRRAHNMYAFVRRPSKPGEQT